MRRNVCAVLARRQIDTRALQLQESDAPVPRAHWPLAHVLDRDEHLVLLGFSRDGYFLLYVSWYDSCYELQWKRVRFDECTRGKCVDDAPVFRLPVGARTGDVLDRATLSLFDSTTSTLTVWQSSDDALVVAFAADSAAHFASLESSQTVHVSIAPSPVYTERCGATAITNLRFEVPAQSPWQPPKSWQLLQRVRGDSVYHLVLNHGTAIAILVFAIVTPRSREEMARRAECVGASEAPERRRPSDLGVHRFAQNAWYAPPESPLEFVRETFRRGEDGAPVHTSVHCVSQQTFHVEAFLQSFVAKYAAMRSLQLVNYDLQLVAAAPIEGTLFMSCAMELLGTATLPLRRIVMALSLALDIATGDCSVVRALTLPPQSSSRARPNQTMRQLALALAKRYERDIARRVPPLRREQTNAVWTNASVAHERSLLHVHNPRFPISISLH